MLSVCNIVLHSIDEGRNFYPKARPFHTGLTSLYYFYFKASNYKDHLVWDKDDDAAMDFVAACSNIRSQVFGISQKTRFDIKSMAGKISLSTGSFFW